MKAASKLLAVTLSVTVAVAFAGPHQQQSPSVLEKKAKLAFRKKGSVAEKHQEVYPISIVDCGKD